MLTLDPRRHQPTAREVGHDCADRGALVPCKLSSRGDDVVIDVKRRAHYVMLAHHHIMRDNDASRRSFYRAWAVLGIALGVTARTRRTVRLFSQRSGRYGIRGRDVVAPGADASAKPSFRRANRFIVSDASVRLVGV